MKNKFYQIALIVTVIIISSFSFKENRTSPSIQFPYKKQGLTKEQAAAHLLSRFTFGVSQNDINQVVNEGLENWFLHQLDGNLPDDVLVEKLQGNDLLTFSNEDILKKYFKNNQILRAALKEGIITKEEATNKKEADIKQKLAAYMKQKGWLPVRELMKLQINNKVLRAAYTNNQLVEVMTDFWYNHFNIAATKNQCVQFIPVYERDAIKRNALGNFENLLIATAKSPAMLLYLDNAMSSSNNNELATKLENRRNNFSNKENKKLNKKRSSGLNENYAREVMELHTLGVDGGYTQNDVTEVARVLTGWTIYPISDNGPLSNLKKMIEKNKDKFTENGFVRDGDFLFAANRHDDGEKIILGKKFNSDGGYQEGIMLLKMLANHQSTAKFISKKLAVRFVCDNPSSALIDKMAKTFLLTNGNIKQVILTMVSSPEFWNKDALREKVKSPFELAISSIRVLHAEVKRPFTVYNWVSNMGQKLYAYQAPTGFPDNSNYWINTGTLINRMNFGLLIATNKLPGIKYNVSALNNDQEPESAENALAVYAKILLPQRNIDATIKRLKPLLNEQNLESKLNKSKVQNVANTSNQSTMDDEEDIFQNDILSTYEKENRKEEGHNKTLMQIIGIILGSPEFQRR